MVVHKGQPRCPICKDEIQENPRPLERNFNHRCICKRCGTFDFTDHAVLNSDLDKVRHLVSAWIRRQNKAGKAYPLVGGDSADSTCKWFAELEQMGFPEGVSEKLDALLKAYADIIHKDYDDLYNQIVGIKEHPWLVSEVALKDYDKLVGLNSLLTQLGYIDGGGTNNVELFRITAKGWLHLDELRKTANNNNFAFLAMWYHPYTNKYRESIVKAVECRGFKPIIIDQHDFDGFIMDQIVTLIRQSRFLIADFTCRPETMSGNQVNQGVRGGVYWEAGLAYGLGKPVILTCEDCDEARSRLHFDLKQYRTFFWKTEELSTTIRSLPIPNPNFAEKIATHILNVVGKGNYFPDNV